MASISRIIILLFLGMFPLAFIQPEACYAKNEASIQGMEIGSKGGILTISFLIDNCFTPKMEEAIFSGVPTTFRIRVILENRRWLFLKSNMLNVTLERTIKYDQLKKEFRLKLPETTQMVHTTASFADARELMSRVRDLPIIPAWRLEDGRNYTLRVKAELSKVHMPLFFRYILFFVSLWDFETDWHETVVSTGDISP